MASTKFTTSQIEKFNDRIENCLNDSPCRCVFEFYLTNIIKKDNLVYTLKLWMKANESSSFDDDMFDYIDNVDGFNENPLLTLSESHQKFAYVKSECCRLFNKSDIHRRFIYYLVERHKQ